MHCWHCEQITFRENPEAFFCLLFSLQFLPKSPGYAAAARAAPRVPPPTRACPPRARGSSKQPISFCSQLAAFRSPVSLKHGSELLVNEEAAVLANVIVVWHIGTVLKFQLNRWCQDFNLCL